MVNGADRGATGRKMISPWTLTYVTIELSLLQDVIMKHSQNHTTIGLRAPIAFREIPGELGCTVGYFAK